MPEVLFALDQHNWRDGQHLFRGDKGQEYYAGEYSIEPGSVVEVRAVRRTVGSSSIIRLTSRSRMSFRRAWSHIRQDATDVTILWLVRHGRMRISDQRGGKLAEAGELAVTRSMAPFVIDCEPDETQRHEVLHLVIPTHIARAYIADDVAASLHVAARRCEFAIVENILAELLEDDGDVRPDTAELLVRTALQVLGHAIRDRNVCGRLRQSLLERRLQEVLRYIELHLSNPGLSTTTVARGCGISPRYLSYLLKQHGTTFSALVWRQRLRQAQACLTSPDLKALSVSEIAYSVGFKSPAHFSRMFSRAFQINPRDYRAAHLHAPTPAHHGPSPGA